MKILSFSEHKPKDDEMIDLSVDFASKILEKVHYFWNSKASKMKKVVITVIRPISISKKIICNDTLLIHTNSFSSIRVNVSI
jgi:hypothetical protein